MTDGTHLTGLEGTNPLGFLAALGVQVLFEHDEHQPMLWWTDSAIPHAVTSPEFDVDALVDQALQIFTLWAESSALSPGLNTKADNDAKFTPTDLRRYLSKTRSNLPGNAFASALVAEGGLDRLGKVAKPSALYFAAGPQRFLAITRRILHNVTADDLRSGLLEYRENYSKLPSLKWDIGDDVPYAIAASKPGVDKRSNPGQESLAILGMSRYPVYCGSDGILTQGYSGPWKNGTFTWPLWTRPATSHTVRSLLTHASAESNADLFRGWGIDLVLSSTVGRTDEGGYGYFSPPQIRWSVRMADHNP